jgi:hypothetical protein
MASATIGAIVWNYTYNGKEQLAIRAKVSPVATTHFIHDLWGNVLAETNGTAAGTTREYIWLPEVEIAPADGARSQVDRPIAVVNAVNTATPATWYVSVDHLNRPIKMTDAAKASVWDAVWQPWGGVHSITGTASLDARLPGQWFQAETGLHYNWHRQYELAGHVPSPVQVARLWLYQCQNKRRTVFAYEEYQRSQLVHLARLNVHEVDHVGARQKDRQLSVCFPMPQRAGDR